MNLTEDQVAELINLFLDDLEAIHNFVASLEIIKPDPVPVGVLIAFAQGYATDLALGKTSIVKMLISQAKVARPSEKFAEILDRYERIENEIIKKEANNEQED